MLHLSHCSSSVLTSVNQPPALPLLPTYTCAICALTPLAPDPAKDLHRAIVLIANRQERKRIWSFCHVCLSLVARMWMKVLFRLMQSEHQAHSTSLHGVANHIIVASALLVRYMQIHRQHLSVAGCVFSPLLLASQCFCSKYTVYSLWALFFAHSISFWCKWDFRVRADACST